MASEGFRVLLLLLPLRTMTTRSLLTVLLPKLLHELGIPEAPLCSITTQSYETFGWLKERAFQERTYYLFWDWTIRVRNTRRQEDKLVFYR